MTKAKVKELLFWGVITAIVAGIAYMFFIPEEEYLTTSIDDDEDDFVEEDDSL